MSIHVDIKKNLGEYCLDIQFDAASRRIGILGASGCGKTLTLKSIAGIFRPDEGRITVGEKVFFDSREKINIPPQRRHIGYLFQNYALFPNMTVEENLAIGLRYGGTPAGEGSRRGRGRSHSASVPGGNDEAGLSRDALSGTAAAGTGHSRQDDPEGRVREIVRMLSLTGLEKLYPPQLSGGQQQRVALGRILAYMPEVILLDEPFSALDSYLRDRLQTELFEILSDYPGTIIMVSHSRDEIYRFADELVVIDGGRVISFGETKAIFRNPENKATARLTGCKNFSRAERIDAHTLYAPDWGIRLTLQREVPEWIQHVGYRAHYFEPVYGERKENCIRFSLKSKADMPFEKNFYLRPETDAFRPEDVITWFVQRDFWPVLEEKGLPDYLQFKEEGILFLR